MFAGKGARYGSAGGVAQRSGKEVPQAISLANELHENRAEGYARAPVSEGRWAVCVIDSSTASRPPNTHICREERDD